MKIGVVGLGKLGAVMAALYASRGFDVVGVDQNEWLVEEIRQGRCPIQETGLEELLASCKNKLQVTTTYDNVRDARIIFIIVPTPSNKNGEFSSDYVLSAVRSIGLVVKGLNQIPLVVVTSTVMPGTMEMVIKPELERIIGKEPSLCYNPEFIALGSVIRDMEHPDSILIGESDEESGNLLSEFYHQFHGSNVPPISRMSLWNAEFAKLALNTFVTAKISLANTYAMLCNIMPQGDVDSITNFLGLDSRIGHKYLKGGLGYAGECFPRDCRAFITFASKLGIETPLQKATDKVNGMILNSVVKDCLKLLSEYSGETVSVLGLTFKPNTPIVTESQSLSIARILSKHYRVKVYDPMGIENAKKELGDLVEYSSDVSSCLYQSDLCVLATPWGIFKELCPRDFDAMRTRVILDCWRFFDRVKLEQVGVMYFAIGINDAKEVS